MLRDLSIKLAYKFLGKLTARGYLHDLWYPRYQFQMAPRQLCFLAECLEKTRDVEGAIVEIGCAHGLTTTFLYEYMIASGFKKKYICIDTFEGFTADDISTEEARGKAHKWYSRVFKDNKIQWFKESLQRRNIIDVEVIKADISTVDHQCLPQTVAFCLVDVDLYRPVKSGLETIFPRLSSGGILVVDDCWVKPDALAEPFDGALQAYREFIANNNLPERLVETKLAVIERN